MIKTTLSILCLLACASGQAAERLSIGRIQGAEHQSPYLGEEVITEGIVTRVYKNGFIIQSRRADASPETSEAIYIFQEETKVRTGNELRVTGKVEEWTAGNGNSYNLPLTQMRADKIKRLRRSVPLPKPVVLNYLLSDFPPTIKQPGSAFNVNTNALDFWESMEHMRVVVMDATVVGPRTRFGEIAVSVPQAPLEPATVRGGAKLTGYDFNPPRILVALSPENTNSYSTGDRIKETIHGNLTYSYGNYKIASSKSLSAPKTYPNSIAQEETIPEPAFKLATFNVENLFTELPDDKFERLAHIILNDLLAPDVLALQEIHDNSGPQNNGIVDASETLTKLIQFIESAGGPHYRFLQIDPENNADGGWPGANIRNAFLFQDSVELGKSYLLKDPVFNADDTRNYSGTRKPLVGFFTRGDSKYIFINCHLKSKGGDSPSYGSLLPAIRFSETQRIAQTRVIRNHVDQLEKEHPEAGIVILGDMNDFEFSPAVERLTQNQGLVNLIDTVSLSERYTYIYQGYSQMLDHILVSRNLASIANTRILHVNSDISEDLRASDHDPIVTWINEK